MTGRRSGWRRWFGGPAAEEPPRPEVAATPLAEVPPRTRATVVGRVERLGNDPAKGWFQADLVDESGRARLIWMGRDTLACLDEGMRLRVEGMVTGSGSEDRTIYNPAFDVLPG